MAKFGFGLKKLMCLSLKCTDIAWATLQRSTAGDDLSAKASSGSEMKTGNAVWVRSPPRPSADDDDDPRSSGMRSRGSLLLEDFLRCVEGVDTSGIKRARPFRLVGAVPLETNDPDINQ